MKLLGVKCLLGPAESYSSQYIKGRDDNNSLDCAEFKNIMPS